MEQVVLKKFTCFAVIIFFLSACQPVTEAEKQANSFAKIFGSLCLKHVSDFEVLRDKLKEMPSLPPEKAKYFLADHEGQAWPVPDKHGTFVLVLPTDKNFCAVHARRADTQVAMEQFVSLVENAPPPLLSKEIRNEQHSTVANGNTQTVAYEWSKPDSPTKMLFTITVAPLETAQLQVLGSVAMVSE